MLENSSSTETSLGQYYIAFFGDPSDTSAWEVQFGGHHLGINAAPTPTRSMGPSSARSRGRMAAVAAFTPSAAARPGAPTPSRTTSPDE
ncbi:DUF3500 domain-containing protein, partial [Bacillus sp. SIMBA_008]|uniref:DUF3500 domain-containing protein n=1 Tax=Bacillus sp. SIMBA_008 TaxID=3085757 RepID=UPI00397BD486